MRGHNYGLCRKCGKVHNHHKSWLGKKLSSEHRRNIAIGTKAGMTKEIRKKMSLSWKGRKGVPHTEEAKRKMSLAHKGRKLSLQHRKKISEAMKGDKNPNFGKVRSPEHCRKISEAKKGEKHHFFGKRLSEEHRRKKSEALKGKKAYYYGKTLSEDHKQKIRESMLKHLPEIREKRSHQVLPQKDTSIEVALQEGLKEKGITFEKHFPVFGQPDIAFPSKKIAVFADGDYWHSTPKAKKRDKLVNDTLEEKGWTVLRFWGHEIRETPLSCVKQVEEMLIAKT